MPKISVFIPLYNSELFIQATIQSVISQTFTDWELIILDDCSQDKSYELAKTFEIKDSRIKVLKNEKNLGMLSNWNKGIEICHNNYFVKLDADDMWHPSFLEESLQVMLAHREVGILFTKYVNIDESGEIIMNTESPLPHFAKNKPFDTINLVNQGSDKMLSFNILRQGISLIQRDVFNKIGTYNYLLTKETQASADSEFYFRVGCHYKIYCMDKTLYYYRVHKNSISSTDSHNDLSAQKIYEIKYCILQYYYNQGKITKSFFLKETKRIKLLYNFYRAYNFRKQYEYGKSLNLIGRNFYLAPLSTIKFYLNRLLKIQKP